MKKIYLTVLMLLPFLISYSQVGIGTSSPNASAILDVNSTTKGLLIPRLTQAQLNAISTPAPGLVVYCTDCKNSQGCLMVYRDSQWECTASGSQISAPVATAATSIGCNAFTANWNSVSGALGYYLDVSPSSDFSTFVSGYQNRGVGLVTSLLVEPLSRETKYYYRVKAYNAAITSNPSSSISVTTLNQQVAPPALAATNRTMTGFTANWNVVSGSVSYRLDVSTVSNFSTFVTGYNDLNVGTATYHNVVVSAGTYYYRVRSESNCGYSDYSNVITTSTGSPTCGITFTYSDVSAAGYTWMDRNLGASRVATSATDYQAYGSMFQWGRQADGHQCLIWTSSSTADFVNGNTLTRCTGGICPNALFAGPNAYPFDWNDPAIITLWNGTTKGVNDPCPSGYRVPTLTELTALNNSFTTNNSAGAFGSPVKLTLPGQRYVEETGIVAASVRGNYWSSTRDVNNTRYLAIYSTNMMDWGDANPGYSVRCIEQ